MDTLGKYTELTNLTQLLDGLTLANTSRIGIMSQSN